MAQDPDAIYPRHAAGHAGWQWQPPGSPRSRRMDRPARFLDRDAALYAHFIAAVIEPGPRAERRLSTAEPDLGFAARRNQAGTAGAIRDAYSYIPACGARPGAGARQRGI